MDCSSKLVAAQMNAMAPTRGVSVEELEYAAAFRKHTTSCEYTVKAQAQVGENGQDSIRRGLVLIL